jgi:hypothetical protein
MNLDKTPGYQVAGQFQVVGFNGEKMKNLNFKK